MTGKRRKATTGTGRSTRTTTAAKRRVSPDGSDDSAVATGPGRSTGTATLVKTKRTTPNVAQGSSSTARTPRVLATAEQIDAHDQVLSDARKAGTGTGLAAKFAKAVQRIGKGVTIGIDSDLNLRLVTRACETVTEASSKGHVPGKEPVADGLEDRRMRDLDATVRGFVSASAATGNGAAARAHFAAAVLGVAAADATQVNAVADAVLEGLRARLTGGAPRNDALPKDVVNLLNVAAKAWRSTSEADFWEAMAAVARPAGDVSPEAFLREQVAWMGLIATLSIGDSPPVRDGDPPWTWNSAAEKADLVDELVTAAAGSTTPVTAILRRLRTLQRGADPIPRAIAAELAQLAMAALAGVRPAEPPDRRDVLKVKERAPDPGATDQDKADHRARDGLRVAAETLVGLDEGIEGRADPFDTALFRNKLSTLYVEWRERLRHYQPQEQAGGQPPAKDDLPGEQRYRRLLEVVGPLDGAVVEALDAWSAAVASGSTDPADYLAAAREAEAALEGFLQRLDGANDPKDRTRRLYKVTDQEKTTIAGVIRRLAGEVAMEAGEVLLGQVAPPTEPAAGLRHRLRQVREDRKLADSIRKVQGALKTLPIIRQLPSAKLKPKPAWLDPLTAAATAFDAANATKPPDRQALEDAAKKVLAAGRAARAGAATLPEEGLRQGVVDAVDRLYLTAAQTMEKIKPPQDGAADLLAPQISLLRQGVPQAPGPAPGVGIDKFWSDKKADALRALPAGLRKKMDTAMGLDLRAELARLSQIAAAGDADAIEAQGWTVLDIVRTYKDAIRTLPDDVGETRARLLAALDGVAVSVEALLPTAPVAVEV